MVAVSAVKSKMAAVHIFPEPRGGRGQAQKWNPAGQWDAASFRSETSGTLWANGTLPPSEVRRVERPTTLCQSVKVERPLPAEVEPANGELPGCCKK